MNQYDSLHLCFDFYLLDLFCWSICFVLLSNLSYKPVGSLSKHELIPMKLMTCPAQKGLRVVKKSKKAAGEGKHPENQRGPEEDLGRLNWS